MAVNVARLEAEEEKSRFAPPPGEFSAGFEVIRANNLKDIPHLLHGL